MWGCIGWFCLILCEQVVPSLYVRVYRNLQRAEGRRWRSLTVCEGVSSNLAASSVSRKFPHCMWGCIDNIYDIYFKSLVPSLYVRVYRICRRAAPHQPSSLTVCEGVSYYQVEEKDGLKFPHCMWGCIGRQQLRPDRAAVPSLYVRVYRPLCLHIAMLFGSLIVCESVSILLTLWRNYDRFTHCIWWCIGNQSRKETSQLVPSLYVRLHFVNNYLFCLTLS